MCDCDNPFETNVTVSKPRKCQSTPPLTDQRFPKRRSITRKEIRIISLAGNGKPLAAATLVSPLMSLLLTNRDGSFTPWLINCSRVRRHSSVTSLDCADRSKRSRSYLQVFQKLWGPSRQCCVHIGKVQLDFALFCRDSNSSTENGVH